jgi:hypothetical protein
VSSPSLVVPLKNSTLATLPSVSAAVAASEIFAGAVKTAPFAGDVSETVAGTTAGRIAPARRRCAVPDPG